LIAKTRRSQEQTPATRTGPRVKTLILQGNPQRWAPSAFTETRPRKTRANASAHSLFTCQRPNQCRKPQHRQNLLPRSTAQTPAP